jgi:hypothetical protein
MDTWLIKMTEQVTAFCPLVSNNHEFSPLFAFEVETMLCKVSKIAPGRDSTLQWLFSRCTYELAEAVTHIYNCTLSTGTVPCRWLTAVITSCLKTFYFQSAFSTL